MGCVGRPLSSNCARDWLYLSSQCEASFLSYPDTSLHFLLLTAAILFFSLLSSNIFYGNTSCGELFNNFSSIWKLRNSEPVTKVIRVQHDMAAILLLQDVEWRRRMQLILSQLKSGTLLTCQYSLYHGLGLALDCLTLLLVSLYTLHYWDVPLPSSYFALTNTEDGNFACLKPNKSLYQWFGIVSTVVMLIKVRGSRSLVYNLIPK